MADRNRIVTPHTDPDRRTAEEKALFDREIGPREVGGRYYDGYWGRNYTVLEIEKNRTTWPIWQITIKWDGSKEAVSHCTAWDSERDRVIA